ncbi:hypothetical protein [Undibacterium oligocarboniphilum]|uniref:Uncharacterized protein n=1 Tax=Undibacterium oligocarboniphilum TaxID=666702 RepID=A0A850QRA1_9BURK|nr:hypothetical protein [Undibacterium oligocarboniphilum]MBC3871520.1 hypothetical protein [Undibacterium oligocarboniphilum]NVO78904.1 hypothetical protein [Undibacterium oligocarboniphilum]
MRITKYVEVEAEIEVDVSFSDLVSEMKVSAENTRAMLTGFSNFMRFSQTLPDELLSTLNEKQREIIVNTLSEQLARISSIALQSNPVSG